MTTKKRNTTGRIVNFNDPVEEASYWAREAARTPAGPTARAIQAIKEGKDVKLTARPKKKD